MARKIKTTVDEYIEERDRITKALQEVLLELKAEPYGIHSNSELIGLSPLEWKVTISFINVGRVIITIHPDDIKVLTFIDDSSFPISVEVFPEDIHQILREVILRKIADQLSI